MEAELISLESSGIINDFQITATFQIRPTDTEVFTPFEKSWTVSEGWSTSHMNQRIIDLLTLMKARYDRKEDLEQFIGQVWTT